MYSYLLHNNIHTIAKIVYFYYTLYAKYATIYGVGEVHYKLLHTSAKV